MLVVVRSGRRCPNGDLFFFTSFTTVWVAMASFDFRKIDISLLIVSIRRIWTVRGNLNVPRNLDQTDTMGYGPYDTWYIRTDRLYTRTAAVVY